MKTIENKRIFEFRIDERLCFAFVTRFIHLVTFRPENDRRTSKDSVPVKFFKIIFSSNSPVPKYSARAPFDVREFRTFTIIIERARQRSTDA